MKGINNMKRSLVCALVMLAGMLVAPMTLADIHLLTGANGIGSPDPNFEMVMPNGTSAQPVGIPTHPVWAQPTNGGHWIGPAGGNVSGPVGVYTYTYTFTLNCPDEASINGVWSSDDVSEVLLNGVSIASSSEAGNPVGAFFFNLHDFGAAGVPPFKVGENTLEIKVINAVGPTGIFVDAVIIVPPCVCCLDFNQEAPSNWVGHPDLNKLGFNVPVFPPLPQWQPVPIDRFLSCYMYRFPADGLPVTEENCEAAVGKFSPIPPAFLPVKVLSAHWYPGVTLGQLKTLKILPRGVELLASFGDDALKVRVNGNQVDLTLKTLSEEDVLSLLILRVETDDNGLLQVQPVCSWGSNGNKVSGASYECTDENGSAGSVYMPASVDSKGEYTLYLDKKVTAE